MIEDVYEPLVRYRDEFRQKFASLAREKFNELARKSNVDVRANRALVGEIMGLQAEADSASAKKTCFGWLMALGFIGAVAALVGAVVTNESDPKVQGWCIAGVVAGVALGCAMIPLFKAAAKRLSILESQIASKKAVAWKQMEPLNRLYTWDMTVKLIEATVPRLEFDPYFTVNRLAMLHGQFGWDDSFNDGKSIIFAQSGVINGNPFVFGHYLDMEWGEKTYEGTKRISWTEWERGPDGKRRLVHRHETLHAYVTKPIPVYSEQKLLVYGNDAAPNLSFSRQPSGLTGKDGELLGSIRKKWRLSRLKAYSRNLDDDSNFTLMGNHEFETWFHAKDRDDEVEFRLLFTPVAQTQMLNLMKDTTVGYGDDFTFIKQKKVNVMFSRHLNAATIDTDPSRFWNWDYDAAEAFFMSFNERYFKDAYFALAPLLSIPLYQQTRTHEEIWKDVIGREASSFWEHEAVANYYGEDKFKHPSCVTRSILKTQVVRREDGESAVAVTAHGYRGEERVDHKMVHGGDGKSHDVAVRWVEYLPVQRTSEMCLCEGASPSEAFKRRAAASRESSYRRSILSFLSGKLSVLLAALFACGAAIAAAVSPDGAFRAARAWHGGAARHMGRSVGAPTGRTRTFSEGGTNLFHLVELSGGGFVAVAAADSRPPVMAFSPSGDLPEADDGGPLWTMLAADGAAASGLHPRRRRRRRLSMRESRSSPVARLSASPLLSAAPSSLASVSDVRVAPLVGSKWDQKRAGGKNTYNYYTTNHWYCGCVATAMAQLMRYHRYPVREVAAKTFTCYCFVGESYVPVDLTMKGGLYNWDLMPLVPGASTSDEEREMIGRLCYDAGVSVRMRYASGGSGALGDFAHDPLKNVFGYANAESYLSNETLSAEVIEDAILANLDAGCPVMLGIFAPNSSGQDAGHAILADGYGYEDDTLWCHLNLGWSGSYDLWYALPNIPAGGYAFSVVDSVVYNVFPAGTGQLVTGRVTDDMENPLEGAVVTASYTSGFYTITTNVTTSSSGIYAFRLPPSSRKSRSITLRATYGAAVSGSSTTSIKASSSPYNLNWETGGCDCALSGLVVGNSWGNDLSVTPAAGAEPSVSSFSNASESGLDGFSISFAGTGGARYEIQYKTNLVDEAWVPFANILVTPSGSSTIFLPVGEDPAGFYRIVPIK